MELVDEFLIVMLFISYNKYNYIADLIKNCNNCYISIMNDDCGCFLKGIGPLNYS